MRIAKPGNTLRLIRWIFVLAIVSAAPIPMFAQTFGCTPAMTNAIVCENSKTGTPQSVWDVVGYGDASIMGFPTDISVNAGNTISFKIATNASAYTIAIYRLGYYSGNGARLITTFAPSATLPQVQPNCDTDATTGLFDCGNWGVSASWAVPSNATSGVYIALLTRTDTGGASQILFVVRNDSSTSNMMFQTSDTTWQAYNWYGGSGTGAPQQGQSLYGCNNEFNLPCRAYKVSYNRPLDTRNNITGGIDNFFMAEYPMVRWLEKNGYDITYASDVDTDRSGSLLLNHKVYLSNGHDEYWSSAQRTNVETARAQGVNLGFFTANQVFWKTRWESSIDGSNTTYRTLVCYKETNANAVIDPADPPTWTGTWRDPRFSPPADGGRPENALAGTLSMVDGPANGGIIIPQTDGTMRFWRNTAMATLGAGQSYTMANGTLGEEYNEDIDNGFRPAGLFWLSTSNYDANGTLLLDYGSTYGTGPVTHHMSLYRYSSGALVFNSGTYNWSWGLDSTHDIPSSIGSSPVADLNVQQATVNLFADMSVQPASLASGLLLAMASTDTTPPSSVITSPTSGSSVTEQTSVTISGTATDSGGGVVAAVEVSVDGGTTWHPATGRGIWAYTWVPTATGSATIRSRAVDDSGNLETPSPGVTVTISSGTSGYSLWPAGTPGVLTSGDTNAVELGVKFYADVNGNVTAIRFYKGPSNTGTHVGNLWTISGTLLGTGTFTGETSTGWQQMNLATPVAITAGTVYVASYHTSVGEYSTTPSYFTSQYDNAPLHALKDGANGGDGVYMYAASSTFPTNTFGSTNYWVDLVFQPTSGTFASVTTVTLNPTAVNGGTSSTGTVTLSGAAPSGGASVTLSSSDGAAAVPASVTVLAGQTTANFQVTTIPVSTAITPTITGTYNGTASAQLTVNPPVLSLVSLNPNGVVGGTSSTGTVTLGSPAPVGGALVTLSSNSVVATVPSSVTVAAGATTANFLVTTSVVTSIASATITATYSGVQQTATLGVFPSLPTIASVTLNPQILTGGIASTGTVTLSFAAPAGGALVTLSGNDETVAIVDGSTTVAAGATTATFNVFTNSVNTVTPVTITGSYNGTQSTTLIVNPAGISLVSIWDNSATPLHIDSQPVITPGEYGMRFTSDSNGYILGVRFYKGPSNVGTHVGNLWSSAGQLLATATFTAETASGWQQVLFSNPVQITANTDYIASYYNPTGDFSYTDFYFALGSGADNAPLHAPPDSVGAPNGVFASGPSSSFPNNTYDSYNYWVDVIFDPTPTNLTMTTPYLADGFETGFYFQNLGASGGTQPYTWTLAPGSSMPPGLSLTPAGLISGTATGIDLYNFTVELTDSSPSPQTITQPLGIYFAPAGTCPCTIWPSDITPLYADSSATTPGEFGVHFHADSDGDVVGIRFYKGPLNTGTHVGNLWSNSGQLLATATFTGETASGWQQVNFSSPVHITANTEYVASYYSPTGDYSYTDFYFALGSGADNAPLHAPPDTQSTPDGVYAYGATSSFPSNTFNSYNYWVDLVFNAIPGPTLASVSINPSPVTGGSTTTGTVTLSGPAPTGGETVSLASTNSGVISAPATVTVLAGSSSATFTVTTYPMIYPTAASIIATGNGIQSGSVTVNPPSLASISLNPTTVVGGTSSTATVTLDGPAPIGGWLVTLSSSSPSATVPNSVTVPFGSSSATFTVTTAAVTSATQATISGTAGVMQSAILTINAVPGANLLSVSMNPTSVIGGFSSTGTVTLTAAAPAGNAVVSLSSNSAAATVPVSGTVTVPAGLTTATFTVTTTLVGAAVPATITGTYNGTQAATLTVNPITVSSVTFNPTSVNGGTSTTGTVTLNSLAPAGNAVVSLSSNNAAAIVPVSGTVTVLAGATTANFTVTTIAVATTVSPTITATYDGAATGQFTVNAPAVVSVSLNPTSVTGGSINSAATVTLTSPAPTGGIPVAVASTNTAAATVVSPVTVLAGATTANFTVTSLSVASQATTSITATLNGTASATLTVTPAATVVTSVSLNPTSIVGGVSGQTSIGTVTLNGTAPTGGTVVTLTSANTSVATVLASVTVPADTSSTTFTVTPLAVGVSTGVSISAKVGATTAQSATLTVVPPSIISLTMNPTSAQGGLASPSSTGTITLNGPAAGTAAQRTVNLSDTSSAVTVPATATVTAGATTGTFTVTTSKVGVVTTDTITAAGTGTSFGGSANTTFTVNPPAITSVTLNPTSVTSEASGTASTSTGTVTLNATAPTGGVVVTLASSNTAAATVPATVTVASGSSSATFTVTSIDGLAATATTSISATLTGGGTQSATLTVTPVATGVATLSLSASTVQGGTTPNPTATVTLNGTAPIGGAVVTLASTATAATVPATVTVPANASSTTFTVTTVKVALQTVATISAKYNNVTQTATLTVNPPTITAVTLNPTSVTSEASGTASTSTGTVTLNATAPTGGVVVTLASSNTAAATVPATVTVASGSSSATFTVTSIDGLAATATTSISATLTGGGTQSATLTVTPVATGVATLSLSASTVQGGTTPNPTATVTLNGTAPIGGAVVTLASTATAATVPATVTVPANASSTTFTVTTVKVALQTVATISAKYNNVTQTATLTVNPPTITAVTLNPTSVTSEASGTASTSTGTVTLNATAPTGGVVVTLASSNTAAATVPATVTVASGSSSATFTVTSIDGLAATATTSISATLTGGGTQSATLTVTPVATGVATLTLNPTSVQGGSANSTATVTLNGPAPTGGASVTLGSNSTAATVPGTVTVAANATSTTFTVTSVKVGVQTVATISASYNSVQQTAALTVNPPTISSVTLNPTSLVGGATSTATVNLNTTAPTGGVVVNVASNNTAVATLSVTSVTVPSGSTSTTFTVTSIPVAATSTASITGSWTGGPTASATLTVNPPTLSGLSLNPATVTHPAPSTGTVTISGAAPTGGFVVNLSSSNTAVGTVPATMTVAAGSTTGTFTVTTLAAAPLPGRITISASKTGSTTQTANLTVN